MYHRLFPVESPLTAHIYLPHILNGSLIKDTIIERVVRIGAGRGHRSGDAPTRSTLDLSYNGVVDTLRYGLS